MSSIKTHFRIYLFLLLLLSILKPDLNVAATAGQSSRITKSFQTLSREEMYLHFDREKYIAGEDIWFSIYVTDRETGKLSSGSIIAYIELISPWNVPVIQSRFQLMNGKGEGSFLLPDSVSSGTYFIRAYTNVMKNFLPGNCFMQDIDIYNPFKGPYFMKREDSIASAGESFTLAGSGKTGRTTVTIPDSIYGRRQKVTMNLKIDNIDVSREEAAEFSISVVPAEFSYLNRETDAVFIPGFQSSNNAKSATSATQQYNYESDGHFLSFLVKYREGGKNDSSDCLYMSIQGKVAEFNYATRDSGGRFTFLLPVDSKLRNLVIQPEYATANMTLEIEPSFPRMLPETRSFREVLNDSLLKLFSGLSFNYQASKIYGTDLKREEEADEDSNLKRRRFYGIPEMEIYLDDYIRLPDMQEVFFELLPGIIIKSGRTGYELKITNPLTGVFYEEPPLVMIDGVIINNLAVLVGLDPEQVERIEVVKTPYLIGDLILHGIVNVITRAGNFSSITMPDYSVILPYRIVEKPSVFIAPEYSDEQKRNGRIPDLRNTLYWNPSVKINSKGEASVEFWTSDLPGYYTIDIKGVMGTGERISLYRNIIVR